MMRTLKQGGLVVAVLASLGVVGAGCLTRPVESSNPTTSTNFTSVVHNQAVDKLDLLFMIDNSASMGDKQALLALAVPDMITRLVSPNCLDMSGKVIANQHPDPTTGKCAQGTAEFPPVHDMHIGIVTSSLGGRGGDQCDPTVMNPTNTSLNAHNDDRGELINRGGANETPVGDASPDNFLAWFPNVPQNAGKQKPPVAAIGTVGMAGAGGLIGDFTDMISGVHEHGCGFEAQNEAWYRFLVQPDPFDKIVKNGTRASFSGIDATILQQRAAFLRPDSLVAVIVVTDENEEVANPLSIGGQGWAYENTSFPGGPGTAPEGTIECKNQDPNNPLKTGPNDPNCTSCGFTNVQQDPNFAQRCPADPPSGSNGYLDPSDDQLNVRFWNQKLRFGVFAGYPTSRYVRGLTKTTVPDSGHEVDKSGNYIGDQDGQANCVNPLFAQNLPTDATDPAKLCNLTKGPRTPDLIYYAAIAGVPHQLLQAKPGDKDSQGNYICDPSTNAADCPQKETLSDADWTLITGKDPEHYDFTGADFHMVESSQPRTQQGANGSPTQWANVSNCSPTSADDCDKDPSGKVINGREWDTSKDDLQFACIFPLTDPNGNPAPKDCTQPQYQGACDCAAGSNSGKTPLCQKDSSGNYTNTQINGKAYPSVREMIVAHAMGQQGIVSSLCPIHTSYANNDQNDPLFGYRPAVKAIVDRLKNSLSNQCLPQKLTKDQCGLVQCLILVTLPTNNNGEQDCTTQPGLAIPDPTILQKFQQQQHDTWMAGGQAGTDPSTLPTCQLQELSQTPAGATGCPAAVGTFDQNGSCSASTQPGWCYVEGAAANGCPQAILFSNGEPPTGSTVSLQCIEQAISAIPDAGGGGG